MSNQAEVAYKFEREYLLVKLQSIEKLLCEKQDAKQNRTPQYWTHAETLQKINADLADVIDFMSH